MTCPTGDRSTGSSSVSVPGRCSPARPRRHRAGPRDRRRRRRPPQRGAGPGDARGPPGFELLPRVHGRPLREPDRSGSVRPRRRRACRSAPTIGATTCTAAPTVSTGGCGSWSTTREPRAPGARESGRRPGLPRDSRRHGPLRRRGRHRRRPARRDHRRDHGGEPHQPRLLQPRRPGGGTIDDHELAVLADAYTPVDDSGIPLDGHVDVAGTAFDFRAPRPIGPAVRVRRRAGRRRARYRPQLRARAARACGSPRSCRRGAPGRRFSCGPTSRGCRCSPPTSSTAPCRRPTVAATDRATASPWSPSCSRTPRTGPDFPSAVLRPGERYGSTLEWRFGRRDPEGQAG